MRRNDAWLCLSLLGLLLSMVAMFCATLKQEPSPDPVLEVLRSYEVYAGSRR